MTLHFNEYQQQADVFAKDNARNIHLYLLPGLAGEVGELCSLYAKHWRDEGHKSEPLDWEKVKKELGDILWFVSEIAFREGISLLDVAETNIAKLASRQQRGTIGGSGDNR